MPKNTNQHNIKVLMLGWELPPQFSGGLGVACYGLAKELSHLPVDLAFVLPRRFDYPIEFMKIYHSELAEVDTWAINSVLKEYLTANRYHQQFGRFNRLQMQTFGRDLYEEALRYAQLTSKWAAKIPHELIHVHDWMTFPAGMQAKQVSGKPLVAHVHATEFDRAGDSPDHRIAEIEYQGLSQADQIIAVSHFTKRKIVDKYQIPADKIAVVHNGVLDIPDLDMDHTQILPHAPMVFYVGRLTMQKGVDYLIQAIPLVIEHVPEAVFVIAGYGDKYEELIMQASQLGIADHIIFTGWLSDRQKTYALYRRADVFVSPSVSEPFGITTLEALRNHTAVIISKQSGVSEVLNHVFKVDYWDVRKLANLIVALLKYPSLRQEISKHGHRESLDITWEKAARKTYQIYQQLLLKQP